MKPRFCLYGVVLLLIALISCGGSKREEALAAYVSALQAYGKGDVAATLTLANKASSLDPELGPAWSLAGKASFVSGDYSRAAVFFKRALTRNPASIDTRIWLARTRSGPGSKETIERKNLLESVLSDDPGNPYALRMLAQDAAMASDAKGARILLDNAANAASEFGMVFLDRASLRWASGDFQGTLSDLDKALALLPDGSVSAAGAVELRKRILEVSK